MPSYWKKVKQTLSEKFNVKQGQKQVEELKKDGQQAIHRIRKSRKYAKLEDDHHDNHHFHPHPHLHQHPPHQQHHQHQQQQQQQHDEQETKQEWKEQPDQSDHSDQYDQHDDQRRPSRQDNEHNWKDLNSKSSPLESVNSEMHVVVDKKKKKNKFKKIGKRTRRIAKWTWKCLKTGFTQIGPIASGGMSGVGVFIVPMPTSMKK